MIASFWVRGFSWSSLRGAAALFLQEEDPRACPVCSREMRLLPHFCYNGDHNYSVCIASYPGRGLGFPDPVLTVCMRIAVKNPAFVLFSSVASSFSAHRYRQANRSSASSACAPYLNCINGRLEEIEFGYCIETVHRSPFIGSRCL